MIFEKLVGMRFVDMEDLGYTVNSMNGSKCKISKVDTDLLEDHAFIIDLGNDRTLDVYYLEIPFGLNTVYVTEINLEEN